eukprot:gnl/TRDRNA2_/TRDRNA2_172934_c1_seq10.p2 gnl/TRDRNA2_/TRDRNA2_172934_c1~~gnl/TRDRNA2_/TRDRNA2_172934_c1_seq10.p2  ORF type:complete len:150 (+),score=26.59 gnl/TRDRNA2_/TRDRNA2_172934_c1_seq10:400-849(+)
MEFWDVIPAKYEHVLVFESDSLLLQNHICVDRFLQWDFVGAPWKKAHPKLGSVGNGGFSMHRRRKALEMLKHRYVREARASFPDFRMHADAIIVSVLKAVGASLPEATVAEEFAVESCFNPNTCAIHAAWKNKIEVNELRHLLKLADWS